MVVSENEVRFVRSTKCERNGNIGTDKSGNRVCGPCKQLHTDDSFKGAITRTEKSPTVRARSRSERGPEEITRVRRRNDVVYQQAKRLKIKGSVKHALNCVIGGKIDFQKVSEALRKLHRAGGEGSKEAAAMPGATTAQDGQTSRREETETGQKPSSRELKVNLVCDIVQGTYKDNWYGFSSGISLQAGTCFKTVHVRHFYIQQYYIRRFNLGCLKG